MLYSQRGFGDGLKVFQGANAITQALKSRQGGQKSQRVAVEEKAGKIQSVIRTCPTVADFEDRGGHEPAHAGAARMGS